MAAQIMLCQSKGCQSHSLRQQDQRRKPAFSKRKHPENKARMKNFEHH
jgi:hypothetical protein